MPEKADQVRNRKKLGSRGGRPRKFDTADDKERHTVECGINRLNATEPSPRDMTSSPSVTRQPYWSQPSRSGYDQQPYRRSQGLSG
ncbi:hypothetical protein ACWDE9_35190 [Streptomyces olivaceoviridis]